MSKVNEINFLRINNAISITGSIIKCFNSVRSTKNNLYFDILCYSDKLQLALLYVPNNDEMNNAKTTINCITQLTTKWIHSNWKLYYTKRTFISNETSDTDCCCILHCCIPYNFVHRTVITFDLDCSLHFFKNSKLTAMYMQQKNKTEFQ